MIYSRAPITINDNGSNVFLYSQKGLFMIDNPEMALLLRYIETQNLISHGDIGKFWGENGTPDIELSDVIEYLTEEVQVLLKVESGFDFKKIYHITNGFIKEDVLLKLFPLDQIINIDIFLESEKIEDNALYIVDMMEVRDPLQISVVQEKMSKDSTVIFLLMVGDNFVISQAYSRSNLTPCVLCLYDYVMDKIFTDRKNKIRSMSEVINYINENFGMKAPGAPVSELDLFYLMRELEQYLLTFSGNGRSAFTGCDISMSKIININTLEKTLLCIPFSPKCDCLHQYHQHKGYRNA